jgi:hypothetical protein
MLYTNVHLLYIMPIDPATVGIDHAQLYTDLYRAREDGILTEEGKPGRYAERGLTSCLDKLLVSPLLASIPTQQLVQQTDSHRNSVDYYMYVCVAAHA